MERPGLKKEEEKQKQHRFSLVGRKSLQMEGVVEIIRFDEASMILETRLGPLSIKGKEFNIQAVDLEEGFLQLEGFFSSFEYRSQGGARGFFSRLFK